MSAYDRAVEIAQQNKESKGGTFATADIPLIKRALYAYKAELLAADENHPEISSIGNLLHRLGRIVK